MYAAVEMVSCFQKATFALTRQMVLYLAAGAALLHTDQLAKSENLPAV
jgi:hypothetical protein